jgi:methylated-DNA-[protein]-cysteine S-methyltransferase
MAAERFALFPTPIGTCATVWSEDGITGFALPERSENALRIRLRSQFGDPQEHAPNQVARQVIKRVGALLGGKDVDLSSIELDMSRVPPFHQRVYVAARDVPFGATVTYGELATRIDSPKSARAVGQALGRNPFAIIVPCHRIVGASGKLVGFTAHGGITTKQQLLEIEGTPKPQPGNLRLSADW